MKKVLIITYYWPPAGGAGVQRWLKFVKYLRDFGWEPVVYTAENGEMPVLDNSLSKDVPEEVRRIKSQPGKNIYLDGSSVLAHTLIQHDLVDGFNLLVYPLVLGGGKKLFPDGTRHHLKFVESRPFPTGVVLMRYERE